MMCVILLNSPILLALEIFKQIGAKNSDVSIPVSQVICLAGGGEKEDWLGAWTEMLKENKGGDVVIIRARSGPGVGAKFIKSLLKSNPNIVKPNTLTTISFDKRMDVERDVVLQLLRNAEVIFFDGGSQSLYLEYFKNTKFADIVNQAITDGKIIGGTSAGMALLGGINYTAKFGSPVDDEYMVTAKDVLQNPLGDFVDLEDSLFIPPYMDNVITETHCNERERQGRAVGFLARAYYNQKLKLNNQQKSIQSIKAICADEFASLCYNKDGIARIYGAGDVFFMQGNARIEQLKPGVPLQWKGKHRAIKVTRVSGSEMGTKEFDLKKWENRAGGIEYWWVDGDKSFFGPSQ